MSGDYSRDNFNEIMRYSALLMQQGRVLLDSDFNEMVDILKTRIEKLSMDALGNPGFSLHTSPGAFEVSVVPGPQPDLQLSPGRVYVDGKMAEIFDGETFTYTGQPFYPEPPALPQGDAAIYLELWEEELTWVEAPLLDPALGGVDTTTRRRMNFRLHAEGVQAAECGLDVGPPPSAGRLTARAIAVPAPDDPCILPPAEGYRGLENRLYRVEIHTPGALGVALFKWSRDNGSIVSPVRLIDNGGGQTTLTVDRIGRDPVMRFVQGDWVTITDDHREWMDEPGEMALVMDTDEAAGTILLDRAIPTGGGRAFGGNPGALEERHTRIQKWDQTGATNTVDPDGLIATGAGPIPIDLPGVGIELEFSVDPAGGAFRRGDYWLIWARTATAEIDEFTDAPPRGIRRHYAQLAAATGLGGPNAVVTNCRPTVETNDTGCCTIVVEPGDSIQAAIDALPPQGGCVCIKAGVHSVPDTLRIARANVHMHGESPGAILQGNAPLLRIGPQASDARIDMLEFRGRVPLQQTLGIVHVQAAVDVTVENCRIRPLRDGSGVGVGVLVEFSTRTQVTDNHISDTAFGVVFREYSLRPVIARNLIAFTQGEATGATAIGIWLDGTFEPAHIVDNLISGAHQGIVVNDRPFDSPWSGAYGSQVKRNVVFSGSLAAEGPFRALGIDAAADLMDVSDNLVGLVAPGGIGIRASGSDGLVTGNRIFAPFLEGAPAFGIQVGFEGDDAALSDSMRVAGNRIDGRLLGIFVTQAQAAALDGNTVSGPDDAASPFGILCVGSPRVRITGNRIEGPFAGISVQGGAESRLAGNDVVRSPVGVVLLDDVRPTLAANRLTACPIFGAVAARILGRTEFRDNRVINAGFGVEFGIGLGAFGIFGEWHVAGNEVLDTGEAADGNAQSDRACGIWGDLIRQARVAQNLVNYSDPLNRDIAREDRALLLRGMLEFRVFAGQTVSVFGWPVQILGNNFTGTGASALVELAEIPVDDNIDIRFERVIFSDNYCMHISGQANDSLATVVLVGRGCTVTGNQVKATVRDFFSFQFNEMRGPFSNNITSGGALNYSAFPPAPDGQNNFIL